MVGSEFNIKRRAAERRGKEEERQGGRETFSMETKMGWFIHKP